MDLKNAVSIVTGGSGGLGSRICHALGAVGSDVAVVYTQSEGRAAEVVEEVRELGVRAESFRCDVTERDQVEALAPQVLDAFGKIDVLVNNAAYNIWIPFEDLDALTFEEWNKILKINLTGPMLCIKAVVEPMKAQGAGRIVNVSSVAGLRPSGSSIAYAVSKAGLNHMTRCMAVGLGPEIQVNCVAPGYMDGTRMSDNLSPEFRDMAVKTSALQRSADKDDVADQVVAFCRTDSITGQTLVVDSGGFYH